MVKYDFRTFTKLAEFQASLPEDKQAEFQSLVEEGKLVDTASCSLTSSVVLRRDTWLQMLGFPKEVQTTLEDLPSLVIKLMRAYTHSRALAPLCSP